jgi:hypothetical protein
MLIAHGCERSASACIRSARRAPAWRCFKSPDRDRQCFFPLRPQPVGQNRVSTAVTALLKLAQQYPGVPDSRLKSLIQIRLDDSSLLTGADLGLIKFIDLFHIFAP